jgi:leukotriene-A4 hydrolase
MKNWFLILSALCIWSCNTPESNVQPNERSDRTKLMISNMKLARDPHTWSKPNQARVVHLDWNAKVDFATKTIQAVATYDIDNLTDTNAIVLDAKGLRISSVQVDGKDVAYQLSEEKPFIGSALSIPIDSASKKISVAYATTEAAEALLWVEGEQPFLFTQSQAILGRTWIPCQDSPGVRITYNATVEVPSHLMALMSAENPTAKSADGKYTFKMDQPIPAYLIALAVGDIAFKPIGSSTGVYAQPHLIDLAASEFSEMQQMVDAAEKLYGDYVWGRYDVLVLPAAFPFGGMENPKLTFATPTILAGDKSLVSLVAHELAHSWSGNLVTNATWNDFWLNEGFTVYFEQRIMEAVYGRERSEMLAQLARQELDATLLELKEADMNADTRLKLALEDRSPDDGMTDIAYNKGYFFLRLIEETTGREKFDAFLKEYFTSHAFQVMETETFLAYLRKNLLTPEQESAINVQDWVYGEGIPNNIPIVNTQKFILVDLVRTNWEAGKIQANNIGWAKWSYQERVHFISNLSPAIHAGKMQELDNAFEISSTGNNEVLFVWLLKAIDRQYTPAYAKLHEFLTTVGRRKFVKPLYEELIRTDQTALAQKIYLVARPHYHAVTVGSVDALLASTSKSN